MGVCLQVVRREFSDGRIPTLSEHAFSSGLSRDTIRRASDALLPHLRELLEERRPGPRRVRCEATPPESHPAFLALQAVIAILLSLLGGSTARLFDSKEKRGRVVEETLRWKTQGLEVDRLARWLGLSARTLKRWIDKAEPGAQGLEVPLRSRRPEKSPSRTPWEIREAIFKLGRVMKGASIREIALAFRRQFKDLLERHGLEGIATKTVGRYLQRSAAPDKECGSRRGEYEYPPPFAMAWIDTTCFTVAGIQVHIVGAMEAFSRMVLSAEVFVQETAKTNLRVLASTLRRIPELTAVLRDRGTPYLNEQVNDFLADNDCLPIDAHPYWPLDKAALERWWGTLKPWLRQAVSAFEDRCLLEGRTPAAKEVVEIVRSALSVIVRAYNLLPQKSFEESCPFERLEAALRDVREHGGDDSLLRSLHAQRRDRDGILSEIGGALQLSMDLRSLRRCFLGLSKQALEYALVVCHRKLVDQRDPGIIDPLKYFAAVAMYHERRIQAEEQRRARLIKEKRARRDDEQRRIDEQRRLHEDRCRNPDKYLIDDLRRWAHTRACGFVLQSPLIFLWQTLRALRLQSPSQYHARIGRASDQISNLVLSNPDHPDLADKVPALQREFDELALAALRPDAINPPRASNDASP